MSEHPTVAETIAELRRLGRTGRDYYARRIALQAAEHLARASSLAPVAPDLPLLDQVEAEIQQPGYGILRGWLAIHGGASARIVLEEITQLVRVLAARDRVAPPSGSQTCDCGEKLTQCSSCAVADWQAAHPNCPQCCVTPPPVSPPDVRVIFNNLVKWARSRLSEFEDVPPDIYESENVISRWSPLPRSTEPEALRALESLRDDIHEAATDLVHDAASWRETSDVTGGYAAASLVRDALENEERATKLEAWADRLEDAVALVRASSPPPPVSPDSTTTLSRASEQSAASGPTGSPRSPQPDGAAQCDHAWVVDWERHESVGRICVHCGQKDQNDGVLR